MTFAADKFVFYTRWEKPYPLTGYRSLGVWLDYVPSYFPAWHALVDQSRMSRLWKLQLAFFFGTLILSFEIPSKGTPP